MAFPRGLRAKIVCYGNCCYSTLPVFVVVVYFCFVFCLPIVYFSVLRCYFFVFLVLWVLLVCCLFRIGFGFLLFFLCFCFWGGGYSWFVLLTFAKIPLHFFSVSVSTQLLALVITAISAYILVIKNKTVHDAIDFFFDPSTLMCTAGAIAVVITFFGWIGALREYTSCLRAVRNLSQIILYVRGRYLQNFLPEIFP